MERIETTFNISNKGPSYKHSHGSFKKNTNDYLVEKNSLEPWDKNSLAEYCTDNLEHMLRNEDYTHVFQILKKFLKFFECNSQKEFEEKVLIPILRKLCVKYRQNLEQVQAKIFENECISYEEDFN
jgi:hypothetical protein